MVQKTNVVKHKPNEYHKKKHTGLIIVIILIVAALATAGVLLFLNREKIFSNVKPTPASKRKKKKNLIARKRKIKSRIQKLVKQKKHQSTKTMVKTQTLSTRLQA